MLMRLIFGACIFSLGYYLGREAGRNEPNQGSDGSDKLGTPGGDVLNAEAKFRDADSAE